MTTTVAVDSLRKKQTGNTASPPPRDSSHRSLPLEGSTSVGDSNPFS